ncbi:MAG TPA: HPr family phosphocarrier protein [Clostridiales bacterium]|nr:HPr family phosphocarrier protein [Clostridiales bacterium]
MYLKQTTIKNKTGLHARPASDFILEAKKYKSKIYIRKMENDSEAVNAKSIARLLSEGIVMGDTIEISADGPDETMAVDKLVALVETGFGE